MYVVRPITDRSQFTGKHKSSPFDWKTTFGQTEELLFRELKMLGAKNAVMEVDLQESQIRLDGRPKSGARKPETPAVAIAFDTDKGSMRFATDRFYNWEHNVRAIALGMEALRKIERYGIANSDQQYTGWRQLEAKGQSSIDAEATIFALARTELDEPGFTVKQAYRRAVRYVHPDVNAGAQADWDRLQAAAKQLGLS